MQEGIEERDERLKKSEMQGQKREMKGSEMQAEREREREMKHKQYKYVNIYRWIMLTYIEGLC